jgi:hypothetical protein
MPSWAARHNAQPQRAAEKNGQRQTSLAVSAMLARPERFELPTPWFVAKYSIQMSYGRNKIEGRTIAERLPAVKPDWAPF